MATLFTGDKSPICQNEPNPAPENPVVLKVINNRLPSCDPPSERRWIGKHFLNYVVGDQQQHHDADEGPSKQDFEDALPMGRLTHDSIERWEQ